MQHRALPTLLKANPKGLHISKLLRGGRKILNGNIPPCRERSDKMFHLCNLKGGVEICLQAWRWVSLSSKTRTRGRKRHWAGFCWYMFLVARACRTEEFLHYCMAFQETWCWLHSLRSLCSHQNSGTLCLVLTAQLPLGAKIPRHSRGAECFWAETVLGRRLTVQRKTVSAGCRTQQHLTCGAWQLPCQWNTLSLQISGCAGRPGAHCASNTLTHTCLETTAEISAATNCTEVALRISPAMKKTHFTVLKLQLALAAVVCRH